MNNVRSQREIHLGVSSFRVFFLFVFFEARERERATTHSLYSSLLLEERFFETDFGEKKDFLEKRSSSGLLFVILRVVVGREREQEEGLL